MCFSPPQAKLHGKSLTGGNRTEVFHWSDLYVGTAMCVAAYLLQFPVKRTFRHSSRGCHYYIIHYVIVLTGAVGSLLSWRGWWNVLDVALPRYIFNGESMVSALIER